MAIRRNIGIPAGVVFQSAATAAPYGYLTCDGTEVLKTDYPALYAAIGDTYGTPTGGSLYFCLPDYRGKFLRGYDGSAGNDPDKASRTAMKTGAVTGNNVGSVQSDEILLHGHPYRTGLAGSSTDATGGLALEVSNQSNRAAYTGALDSDPNHQISGTGGNETRPKNVTVNFIIKY